LATTNYYDKNKNGTTTTTNYSSDVTSGYNSANDAAYQQALAALQQAQSNMPTYSSSYDGQIQNVYNSIVNRPKFQYDINSDALYDQYAQQYQRQGRLAMQDTIGQAAALTGGYDNSYAQSVGQQTYDAYLQNLNDVIPELYGMAYDQYQDETNSLYQQYSMLNELNETEYNKYMDSYNKWLTEREYAQNNADTAYNRGYSQWQQLLNQYNTDREYQLTKENADREYQLALQQFEYNKQKAAAQAAAQAAAAQAAAYTYDTSSNGSSSIYRTDSWNSSDGGHSGVSGKWGTTNSSWTTYNSDDNLSFVQANGGSLYSSTLNTLKQMKAAGKTNSDAISLLKSLVDKSYITVQEYNTLYNKYRNDLL